jgi:hypothetical protein
MRKPSPASLCRFGVGFTSRYAPSGSSHASVAYRFSRSATRGQGGIGEELLTPRPLHDYSPSAPNWTELEKYPQVEGYVLRLSERHAELRREGYRKNPSG